MPPAAPDLVYLDNNATTRPDPAVVDAMHTMLVELWGNPSSVHRFGQAARQQVELARAAVARLLGARPRDVLFTSGGTESNNLAVFGTLAPGPAHADRLLVTTAVEHSAVRAPADAAARRGWRVERLPVDRGGLVDIAPLPALLDTVADGGVALVSVQWANNETGLIQPIAALAAHVAAARPRRAPRRAKVFLHTDATQAAGKTPINVAAPDAAVDLLTVAAHKFHGPKGVGALYVRPGVRLAPQNLGGAQERDLRAGPENSPALDGGGGAAARAAAFLADDAALARQRALRDRFEHAIRAALPDTVVNSADDATHTRLWNTSNLGFPRIEAEAILVALSERGVCASAGAACSSGSLEPSPVLLAMGIPEPIAHGSVRFSLSKDTTAAEIDRAIEVVPAVVRRLMQTVPV